MGEWRGDFGPSPEDRLIVAIVEHILKMSGWAPALMVCLPYLFETLCVCDLRPTLPRGVFDPENRSESLLIIPSISRFLTQLSSSV